jgi:hypothetical protein
LDDLEKQNGCLLLSGLSMLSANGGCKSSSHEVMTLESCGVGPTVRGSQPLFSGIEAVVLETPPGTDAKQNEVHRYAEILYRSILTLLYDVLIVTNVTSLRANDRSWLVYLTCLPRDRILSGARMDFMIIDASLWISHKDYRVGRYNLPGLPIPGTAKLSKQNGVSMVSNKE